MKEQVAPPVYDRFADYYVAGPYPRFTARMVAAFPGLLEHYRAPQRGRLLDVACGEGSFAVAMAAAGWQVTGADQSARMLVHAEENARAAGQQVRFMRQDMRALDFEQEFEVVTCWFDSLNYLLNGADLALAFDSAYRALCPTGWYLFDMNTIYGLAFTWQQIGLNLQQDNENLLELHDVSYDYERNIATLQITGFLRRDNGLWERMDEIHHERGYRLEDIRASLEQAGFEVVDVFSDLGELTPPGPESSRAWFVCRRPG